MANTKTNTVKLGVFVTIAFILFTYGVYRIGDRQSFFSNDLVLYADFSDVKGLRDGNNVRYSGIVIGSVEAISILNDSTLRVEMSVDESAKDYLKKNATADIGSDGLVGNMLVNITPGDGQAKIIDDGDVIGIRPKAEMTEMLETLSVTNDQIVEITQHLLEITEKINQGQGSIAMLINDDAIGKSLLATTQNLQSMTRTVKHASVNIEQMIRDVSSGQGNLGYLLQDTSLKTQVHNLSDNLDSMINIQITPIIENLETSSESITATSQSVEKLLTELDKNNGLVGSLLVDTMITNDLRSTMKNLNEGTQKFDENMEALQHNWFFRKFFKKKKKKEG